MATHCIIMAGGTGTRFWPYSRANRPKQLLRLFSKNTVIKDTVERLLPLVPMERIHIVTGKLLADLIRKDIPEVDIMVEPMARNTAACIGLAATPIFNDDPDATIIIETADHLYKEPQAYLDTLRKALIASLSNNIITLGITPTSPHTGYGYIRYSTALDAVPDAYLVEGFTEKPDAKTAKGFLDSGEYLWNSGIFVAKCSVMLEEIERYMPALFEGLGEIRAAAFDGEAMKTVFEKLESISIDYGIMEKSKRVAVVKTEMPWDDLGDFSALERFFGANDRGNTIMAEFTGNATNCILLSERRPITANNVSNLIIVDTEDVTFICEKSHKDKIKKVIERIREADLGAYLDGIVSDHTQSIISFESEECDIETDGLLVIIGTGDLEIRRTQETLSIEGAEQDIDMVEVSNNKKTQDEESD